VCGSGELRWRSRRAIGRTATAAAHAHGYSRAAFYLVEAAFERSGLVGLLDERPGRRGPLNLSPEVLGFLEARRRERPGTSGAELAGGAGGRGGGQAAPAHDREGARRLEVSGRFWPIAEPAQAGYEQLREIALTGGELGEILAARRFARRGLAGLISWPTAEPAYLGVGDRRAPPGVVWV
jgi:hypothetical protein